MDTTDTAISPGPNGLIPVLLRQSLLEIRLLCRKGNAAQAERLADAAHNLPMVMAGGKLDVARLRADFEAYHQYTAATRSKPRFNYLSIIDGWLGECQWPNL